MTVMAGDLSVIVGSGHWKRFKEEEQEDKRRGRKEQKKEEEEDDEKFCINIPTPYYCHVTEDYAFEICVCRVLHCSGDGNTRTRSEVEWISYVVQLESVDVTE